MASFETDPPPAHPDTKTRRWSAWFIAAFVLLQFFVPLSYLAREDSSDDRFTWRSFTSSEAPRCETRATVERPDGQREEIDVEKSIHPDWVGYVRRGRRSVVDAFLQRQCNAGDVLQVELVNDCDDGADAQAFALRCGSGRAHETVRTAAR